MLSSTCVSALPNPPPSCGEGRLLGSPASALRTSLPRTPVSVDAVLILRGLDRPPSGLCLWTSTVRERAGISGRSRQNQVHFTVRLGKAVGSLAPPPAADEPRAPRPCSVPRDWLDSAPHLSDSGSPVEARYPPGGVQTFFTVCRRARLSQLGTGRRWQRLGARVLPVAAASPQPRCASCRA